MTPARSPSPARPPLTDADYERLLAFRTELRRFLRHSEQVAGAAGLTPALHQLLLAIRGGGPPRPGPTIRTVAEALDVRHHTAVELAQRAEQLGLLSRTRDDDDHRRVHLCLTAKGRRQLERLTREHMPAIGEMARALAEVAADRSG